MSINKQLNPGMNTGFETLLGELDRIDQLINRHVNFAIKENKEKSDYKGLFISDEEIQTLLKRPIGFPSWKPTEHLHQSDSTSKTILDFADYSYRRPKSPDTNKLDQLASIFDLTGFDIDAILLCLAPELDLKYEKIYAYLQDDIARKHPSVDLILNLLCHTFEQKIGGRSRFALESPLLKHQLISFVDDPHAAHPPLLRKSLRIEPQIAKYVLGHNGIDKRLQPFTTLGAPRFHLQDLIFPEDVKARLMDLVSRPEIKNSGITFHLVGAYGVGKWSTASAMTLGSGKNLLRVDTQSLIKLEGVPIDALLKLVNREALLNDAVIYWENFDSLLDEGVQAILKSFSSFRNEQKTIAFISGTKSWEPRAGQHKNPFISFKIPLPDYSARIDLWETAINGNLSCKTDIDVAALSNKFILSGGQIKDVVASANNRTIRDRNDNASINMKMLYSACRDHSNQNLAELAQKIYPRFTWNDIVLPRDKLEQLDEIVNHVKYKQKVYVDWGFENKMSLGKGLPVLFSGPSGTGKTMAAEIMAGELGLDIYKIDLSLIVSKYIGETEKNLSKIFTEAETSNAILFFDEADALFGKRSEVKDSHDRYANIEIAYLLQKMEEYEGITILASNLRKNLDDAFVRRIKFIIEFPIPGEPHRYQIWNVHLPDQAPLGDDLDFEFLARQFELAGGNIKNAVLHAAFLSASDETAIGMKHLIQGIQREYQKSGKVCVKGDFGRYFELLSGNG